MLRKTGMWSLERFSILQRIKLTVYSSLSVIAYGIVLYNFKIAIKTNDTGSLNWMISVILPLTNYYSKPIALYTRKACLGSILQDLQSDAFNIRNEKLNEHIQHVYKISNLLYSFFLFACITFLAMFSVMPVIADNAIMIIPILFDIGKYNKYYRICHMFYSFFSGCISTACDSLYMTLIYIAAVQINILEERLSNVYEDAMKTFKRFRGSKSMEVISGSILRECIILHNAINK